MADEKNLYQKLLNVQTKLKAPKSQYNSFGKYSFRSAEDILEALKPLLQQENLTLTLTDSLTEIGNRVYIMATADLRDDANKLTVTSYAREPDASKGTDPSQITGKASSYARKYALNGLFLIDDNKDADTNENVTERKAYTQQNAVEVEHARQIQKAEKGIKKAIGIFGAGPSVVQEWENKIKDDNPELAIREMTAWVNAQNQANTQQTQNSVSDNTGAILDRSGTKLPRTMRKRANRVLSVDMECI
jgi:hypothetical protein